MLSQMFKVQILGKYKNAFSLSSIDQAMIFFFFQIRSFIG